MPIPRKYFEMGIDEKVEEWMRRINTYLTEYKGKAFTREELHQYYGLNRKDVRQFLQMGGSDFEAALEKLLELEVVEARMIRSDNYYSYGKTTLSSYGL